MAPNDNASPVLPAGPRQPGGARRVIGPIPPRDKNGRLLIKPLMGKSVKLNALKEPVRDDKGQPIEEDVDLRDPREYWAFEHGQVIAEGATKGLSLWQVDLANEPLVLVYAKSEAEAIGVFKSEMGITRFGDSDPKVTKVQ